MTVRTKKGAFASIGSLMARHPPLRLSANISTGMGCLSRQTMRIGRSLSSLTRSAGPRQVNGRVTCCVFSGHGQTLAPCCRRSGEEPRAEKKEKGDGTENHKEPQRVGNDGPALSARFAPRAECVVKPDFPFHGKGGMRGARHQAAVVTGDSSRRGRGDRPQPFYGGAGDRCGYSPIRTNATNRVIGNPFSCH